MMVLARATMDDTGSLYCDERSSGYLVGGCFAFMMLKGGRGGAAARRARPVG